ncbi:MAG TPA: O-antigen ligase family protein [Gaiellales bacterium]
MTVRELLPYGAVIGAGGVALLLLARASVLRLLGLALLAIGLVPQILHEQPSIGDRLQAHPVLIVPALVAGALALAAGTWVALRWPWLVVAGCVIAGLRLPLRDPPSPADHLLPLYAMLACGLLAHAVELVRGRASKPALGLLGPALAGWVVLASASLFWTSSLDKGAFSVIDVALPFGALAALVGSLGIERVAPLRLARVQVALAILCSLVAVYQWHAHHLISNRKLEVDNAYASFYRVNSLFFDPSLFGRFQAIAIITLAGALLLGRRRVHPLLLVLASAAVFAGLALSYSQSSLLALDVGLVVLAAIVWRGRAVLGFGALAVLVLLASLAVPATRHKIFHSSLSNVTSNRSSILSKGIDAFRRHPLIGSGLGSFSHAAGKTPQERARIAPHNVVLQEAVELGVLGLIALAAIVFAILRLLLRPADAARGRELRLVLACELAAIAISSLFYASLFEDPIAWVAAALVALCAAPRRNATDIAIPASG